MAYVPQIKELRVTEILAETRNHIEIERYISEMKDHKLPYRDYVVNIGNDPLP